MVRFVFFISFLAIALSSEAQLSGARIYSFLNLPQSAREASLGGSPIAHRNGDIQAALSNPALIDSRMDRNMALFFSPFMAGMTYGNVAYVHSTEKNGDFGAALQFFSYGKFTETDETGQELGSFSTGDYALRVSNSRQLSDRIRGGLSMKLIYSDLHEWQSFGMAFDAGVSDMGKDSALFLSALIRNVGVQLVPYQGGERQNLPADVQVAISRKVAKAPFRVMAGATSLQRWDLTHDFNFEDVEESLFTLDKLMRHFVLGLEFVPSNKFNLRLGYNYRRQRELQLTDRTGSAGFSGGFEFKMKKYSLSYGFARYHLSSTTHHLNLILNLKEVKRRVEKA